jgi:hypothetical protein
METTKEGIRMNGWFDNKGFNNYYLGKSKYAKKQELLNDFYTAWYRNNGMGLHLTPGITDRLSKVWNAEHKKRIKTMLLGWGYTSAGIDGLFKAFAEWNKNAPK